jgi:leucine dehydrogenase
LRGLSGVTSLEASEILEAPVDVLAPCAIGGVLKGESVERLRTRVVCGAANNLLGEPRAGERLAELGIVVVPDLIASAGAVVDGIGATVMGLSDRTGLIDRLGEVAREVVEEAAASGRCSEVVARELAGRRLTGKG